MASIKLHELHLFHSIDRDIFSRLVITLKRQASQTLLVMALWLWLEDAKHCEIISKLTRLSNNLLDAIANEATLCLNCLKSKSPTTQGGSLHLMSRVIDEEISLKTISLMKYTAISGLKAFLNEVCAWIFSDILLQILPIPSNWNITTPLYIPGFPHPTFGALEIYALPSSVTIPIKGLWGWKLNFEAPIDDRTIFLTFSRGFPVSEDEVRQFFVQMCGDCIESFEMEGVNESKIQSLYARMALRSVVYMDQIMGGKHIAKFRTNGKHIWARKFERREP
ncbi:uncharacterized protein LOC104884180 [Beta vulgaris subsp. vulgaris]|uniref:uncharacterized protein LOC104884180 n=1 Tax=Beta vulgaris subsp. vulgaris TaxID=3555 RepID=UPI00053F4032|nr:uncharacterized protein LOC104884180 [Beta vulgaris subsp. vulgaris]